MPGDDERQSEAIVVSVRDIIWMASEVIVPLILISALDGGEWFHAPAVLPARENPGSYWTGDWLDHCTGLHGRDIRYIINLIPFFLWPYSGLGRLTVEVSRSCTIRNTYPVGLLWSSVQYIVEAATYTTHNKQKGRTSIPSAGFEPVIPAIERPHSYAFHSTATIVGVIRVINKETPLCSVRLRQPTSLVDTMSYINWPKAAIISHR
jgi:hypothetical protein